MAVASQVLGRWYPRQGAPQLDAIVKAVASPLLRGSMYALGLVANAIGAVKGLIRRDPDRPRKNKKVGPQQTESRLRQRSGSVFSPS